MIRRLEFLRHGRFGHQLTLGVHDAGALDPRPVVNGVEFDALGKLVRRSYDDGVERVIDWDQVRGVPLSMTAQQVSGATVLNLYQHDEFERDPDTGRLTGITSTGDGAWCRDG